jgi:hypothetical protein
VPEVIRQLQQSVWRLVNTRQPQELHAGGIVSLTWKHSDEEAELVSPSEIGTPLRLDEARFVCVGKGLDPLEFSFPCCR